MRLSSLLISAVLGVRWPGRTGSERGLTLIETTVMLSVLFILAGALSPVVSDSISTARAVRAQHDLDQIAIGLVNLQRDVGALIPVGGTTAARDANGRPVVGLLVSQGDAPKLPEISGQGSVLDGLLPALKKPSQLPRGDGLPRAWLETPAELLDHHLRENRPPYPEVAAGVGSGWNGPYLSKVIEGDPWGNRYMVNTAFSRFGAGHGGGRDRCAVFVISAGPDGIIQTPFEQPIDSASVRGDDLAVRIQ